MKEILVLLGVFALGYVFTMGFVFALLKIFFPFQPVEKAGAESGATVVKINRTATTSRVTAPRLRKVRLANG